MADQIIIANARGEYRSALEYADANTNRKIDSPAEAKGAAKFYCQQKSKVECVKFLDYLEGSGFNMHEIRARETARSKVVLTPHGIAFPKGHLPKEGATIIVDGHQNAAVNITGSGIMTKRIERPDNVTFIFDCSGSMSRPTPESTESKYNEMRNAFLELLKKLPENVKYNLNIFGPEDTVAGEQPKLNMEVKNGKKAQLEAALKLKTDQIGGATYLWANLLHSVERTRDNGVVILYTDGISDTAPIGTGQEETNKRTLILAIKKYALEHNIHILLACGKGTSKKYVRDLAPLKDHVQVIELLDQKRVNSFFESEANNAILEPQKAYYIAKVNNRKGELMERLYFGNPPDAARKDAQIKKAKAGFFHIDPTGNIQIRDLGTVENGISKPIDLSQYKTDGLAQFIFKAVPKHVPPMPEPKGERRVVALVLDRSGSMQGNNLASLKKNSSLFARHLLVGNLVLLPADFNSENEIDNIVRRFGFFEQVQLDAKLLDGERMGIKVDFLNKKVLAVPSLYDKIKDKIKDKTFTPAILQLIEATSSFRSQEFKELSDRQMVQVFELNRRLIGYLFPQACPSLYLPGERNAIMLNYFPDSDNNASEAIELRATSNFDRINEAINNTSHIGTTPGWENLLLTIRALPNYSSMVIFSDGGFNGRKATVESMREVLEQAFAKNIGVYFIGLGKDFKDINAVVDPSKCEKDDKRSCTSFLKYVTRATTNSEDSFTPIDNIKRLTTAFLSVRNQIEQAQVMVSLPKPSAIRIPLRRGKERLVIEVDAASTAVK